MTIHLIHSFQPLAQPSIVTIGNFDGIHLGHQELLNATTRFAKEKNLKSVLLTFDPYPQQYFQKDQAPAKLTSLREKLCLLQSCALDYVCCLSFNKKLSELSAKQFIEDILIKQLNAKMIIVGEDFRFGFKREGDVNLLKSYSSLQVIAYPAIVLHAERVSSTRVRHALHKSDFKHAQELLGHAYFMLGKVIHGNQRGRLLGFPTANIALRDRALPLHGVFAVKAHVDEKSFLAVANIGRRPTVDGKTVLLEVYLLDFSGDLYGKLLRVKFLAKIRDEKKFESIEALKVQIVDDVLEARKFSVIPAKRTK